ncbi:MAG: hypothetical protein ACP5N2_03960 [Candidatus Nanoarchaeia archaeon]
MIDSFEVIKEKYLGWLYDSNCADYFSALYPSIEISKEKFDSGRIVHRAFTPFTMRSKKPSVYLFDCYFFDFSSGKSGNTKDLIFLDYSHLSKKDQMAFFSSKTGLNLKKILNSYLDEWGSLLDDTNDTNLNIDFELANFSELGINPKLLNNGEWVNSHTGKYEDVKEYYLREFDICDQKFQQQILHYMPSVKREIEKRNKL